MNLEGKTFAVTGGASGIGRATVATLCEARATVFFGDINEEGGEEKWYARDPAHAQPAL